MSTTSSIGNTILGQAESEFFSPQTSGSDSLGKDAFLTLLITQLSYQDPLDPMDDKEFVSQLAQFSSLEQLTNMSTGIQSLIEAQGRSDMINAVNFVGKKIKAGTESISKSGTKISEVEMSIPVDVEYVVAQIYDADGGLVRTLDLGAKNAGTHTFQWDGLNSLGQSSADGAYYVYIGAQDANKQSVEVSTEITGVATSLYSENGSYYLKLEDGRYVDFMSIREVLTNDTSSSSEDTP